MLALGEAGSGEFLSRLVEGSPHVDVAGFPELQVPLLAAPPEALKEAQWSPTKLFQVICTD